MTDAFVYDGLRTPFGRHAGALAPVRPDDLLAGVIKALVARNPFKPDDYEDSVMGCTNQAGEDARNVARHAALLAGLPTSIGGLTVNRLCGSGLAARLRCRARGERRPGRGLRRRRRREHEPRPLRDGEERERLCPRLPHVQFDDRRALSEPEDRQELRPGHHAGDRRQCEPRHRHHAGVLRPLRRGLPGEIRRCQGRGLFRRGDPAGLRARRQEGHAKRPSPSTSIRAPTPRWSGCRS